MRLLKYLAGILVAALLALVIWLAVAPPDLIRVGANYTAKIVCSNVFLAGRDPQDVLEVDVQAPGHPILTVMQVDVDESKGTVHAGLFGLFGEGLAVHRDGFGCTGVPDGDLSKLPRLPVIEKSTSTNKDALWPDGEKVAAANDDSLSAVLADDSLAGPGFRALVVVKNGRIVGERYADGFSSTTPFMGWSMAKTVTAALVGRSVMLDGLDVNAKVPFDGWNNDERKQIKLTDLLGMASDLEWNEGYGTVSDVTRLLYLEPDMARFVASAPLNNLDGSKIGQHFNYSSGSSVLVASTLQNRMDNAEAGLKFPKDQLFSPLGMHSALMETDARGTLVGGSYVYATARDWARLGQFFLQKGNWEGKALLPEGYVDWMTTPHPASEKGEYGPEYGQGSIWLRPPGADKEGDNPDFTHKAYWLGGHDGQSIAILPDQNIVVVRLGLTPSKLLYKPAKLTNAVVKALAQ